MIFHIDVNSAFLSWTSVERIKSGKSDLREVPAIIGGSPEKRTSEFNLRVRFAGLEEGALYHVRYRKADGTLVSVCRASGALLLRGSFPLQDLFAETDVHRFSNPLYTRMFVFEKVAPRKKRS